MNYLIEFRKTEKRYWVNRLWDKRGRFWMSSFSVKNIGIIICKPFCNNPFITIYKLF